MAKKIFLLAIILLLNMLAYSQQIIVDASKYNLEKIGDKAIKKSRKLCNIPKEKRLSVVHYFAIWRSGSFNPEICSVSDFLKHFEICYNGCLVYDDSLNVIAESMGDGITPDPGPSFDDLYVRDITTLNPEYVFDYIFGFAKDRIFFCYKNNTIILVYLADDEKNLVSIPFSEITDWSWFNTGGLDVRFLRNRPNKGIKKITETTVDGWKTISTFDRDGFLLNEVNYYKKEMHSEYKYSYAITDTLEEVKRESLTNNGEDKYRIEKSHYASSGRCDRFEVFLSDTALGIPSYWNDNYVYKNGLLISYMVNTNGEKKKEEIQRVICIYDEKKQKIQQIDIGNKGDTTLYSYIYDKYGQLIDYIKECNNKDTIYSDLACRSDKERNKVHIRYAAFDKRGNWTKSYFITEKGSVLRSKREIQYWRTPFFNIL